MHVAVDTDHAGARAVKDHWRNLSDDQLKAVAGTGGYVGIDAYPGHVGREEGCTVDDVVDHMEHVAALVGHEHVGVGADFAGFDGERVVFAHCAGTLRPIGFAGEVEPEAYAHNVVLNGAAPQVLGDAFLRAARRTRAASALIMISSGAAHQVYEGWTSYGAGKAAVDQWVRAAGAEQARRGNGCRILAVAPGVVATPMQEEIRKSPSRAFPDVDRFIALHEDGELRDPEDAAREIWSLLDRDLPSGSVVDLRDPAEARSTTR